MNKRQKKKREKKRIVVIADEFNLLNMTDEESEEALKEYRNFVQRHTYRKKYKDLKEHKILVYSFPISKSSLESIKNICNLGRSYKKSSTMVTQSFNDFK